MSGSALPPMIAAHATDTDSYPLEVVNVGANETAVPAETLLVVRTTERVGPNSWVWSVSMWRVTWVNLEQDEAARAPAAKKT